VSQPFWAVDSAEDGVSEKIMDTLELEEGETLRLSFDRFKTPSGDGVVPVAV
jgi:hypothetical protein